METITLSLRAQVDVGTFFMKSPVYIKGALFYDQTATFLPMELMDNIFFT